jgi:transcriptional regulator with XRE-family HTH domain
MMQLISPGPILAYNDRMVVLEQVRAARGMLGWSQRQLAEAASVPLSAVKAVEGGKDIRVSVAAAIERALIEAGLIFLEPGDVRDGGRGLRFRLS